ncbi:hypothetical protein K7432_008573 [Basidiobolus ranarum]|uniref:Uncharacterized protein n=1 Tax=Basidiobolus ranarum TaxID=34480 RepID=A0ABR2VYF3_9FUNG
MSVVMSFASYEDPEPGFQFQPSHTNKELKDQATYPYSIVDRSPQAWSEEEDSRLTPEETDDEEADISETLQGTEKNHSNIDENELIPRINQPDVDHPSSVDAVYTTRNSQPQYSDLRTTTDDNRDLKKGINRRFLNYEPRRTNNQTFKGTTESTDDGLSVVLNSAHHLLQAFLVLFKTNQTAFLATASWHLMVGYSLAKTEKSSLLSHAHLPYGIDQLNPTTLLISKFLGEMNLPWAFLALMGFRMKDLSSQKILLLTFAFTSLIQLRFHVKHLSNRQQWKYIFSKHNMGSAIVAFVNMGCYIASIRRSGHLL